MTGPIFSRLLTAASVAGALLVLTPTARGAKALEVEGIAKPMAQEQFLAWLTQRRSAGRSSVVALTVASTSST